MQSVASTHAPTEAELFNAFAALTLDPAQFNHRRHLAFAWRCLQREGFPQGAVRFATLLKTYVDAVGAAAKYHETITWAYITLLNEERVLRSAPDESFETMIKRRADLLDHRSGALSRCYSTDEPDTPAARAVFLLPRR